MARLNASIRTAEIALSAATPKTVLQLIAPTNHRVAITSFGVFFDGTSVTAEPVVVRVLRQSSAGTMSTQVAAAMDGSVTETILSTAQYNATAEPTAGNVLLSFEVHPQQGYKEFLPFGQEIILGTGGRVGIECTAPATVNVVAQMTFEE